MAKPKTSLGQATVTGPSRAISAASLNVPSSVSIAVDTAYVASVGSGFITQGVYMMDNQSANTSSGEGTTELSTVGNVGQLIGFHSVPIDAEGGNGDTVVITGFTVSQGDVFTAAGQPRQQPPLGNDPPGTYWGRTAHEPGPADLPDPVCGDDRPAPAGHVLHQLGSVHHGPLRGALPGRPWPAGDR